ncbi:MAG: hypothetical protein LBU51_10940 [Bacteroidales bacterium]|jgi:hypothetical protein|nr:hypothetical protein [Bacteroidales bacterium]
MKKFIVVLILSLSLPLFASTIEPWQGKTKTILFLIPFYSETVSKINIDEINSENNIYMIPAFQLTAFWEGAMIALKEFERQGVHLNVIVKDVSEDEGKLRKIMENSTLMESVDLIIGPFYYNLFEIAAQYALEYQIPIVNPFSSRSEIVDNNTYVYKVLPSRNNCPPLVENSLLRQYKNAKIILYTEDSTTTSYNDYLQYFSKITKIPFKYGITNLTFALNKENHNIVIVDAKTTSSIISNLRSLSSYPNISSIATFIVPEEWIDNFDNEIEDLNSLEVCFFSNYYINNREEKNAYFISEYLEQYANQPSISRFSFQGYDITRYFVQLLVHDFDTSKIKFQPVALDFDFMQHENGGFENQRLRLIQLKKFEKSEVK